VEGIEADQKLRLKIEKCEKKKIQYEEDLVTGKFVKCCLCEAICKRGVTMPCCGSAACRGCAVKKITVKRGCWIEDCGKPGVTSEELVNDEELREAVKYFQENGTLTNDLVRSMMEKKNLLRKKSKGKILIAKKNLPGKPQFTLLIANIPRGTNPEELNDFLGKFGNVSGVEIKNENITTTLITVETVDSANTILHEDLIFNDQKLRVEFNLKRNPGEYVLWVDKLEEGTSEEDFEKFLMKYGEVKEIKNFNEKNMKGGSQTLAIMKSPLGTKRILDDVKNLTINEKKVLIKLARRQPVFNRKPREDPKPKPVAKPVDNTKVLIVKGFFKKEDEEELLKLLGKFGKISDSKLKPSRIGLEGKKKGKEIPGSGEITFVKPGSVKAMCEKGELEFLGNTIKMRQKGQQIESPAKAINDASILVIKCDFNKDQEDDLLQLLAKFGKITDSKLKPTRIVDEGKKKGKKIFGSGVVTYAKPGSVKTLTERGQLDFKGTTIQMKQKGGAFPSTVVGGVDSKPEMTRITVKKPMPVKRGYNAVGAWHGPPNQPQRETDMWSRREMQTGMGERMGPSGHSFFQGFVSGGIDMRRPSGGFGSGGIDMRRSSGGFGNGGIDMRGSSGAGYMDRDLRSGGSMFTSMRGGGARGISGRSSMGTGHDTMEYTRHLGGGDYSRGGEPPSKMMRRYQNTEFY